ncbi:MAG: biotin transporter BioY [Coriobacteriia bacterium]|nr:biotin transporter BioY [Coriobacteriia bacterium]
MTALMAVTGWIAIPLGSVPVTLQVFGVVLAALLLPAGWAAASLGAYLVLGAAGVPVFASGQVGLGVVVGPTGGYLFGFVLGASLGALVRGALERRTSALVADAAAALVVIVAVYAAGWAQLSLVAHLTAVQAFIGGVAPFVIPDAVKAAVAIVVARGVRRAGVRL